jgi:hypothetical protein
VCAKGVWRKESGEIMGFLPLVGTKRRSFGGKKVAKLSRVKKRHAEDNVKRSNSELPKIFGRYFIC